LRRETYGDADARLDRHHRCYGHPAHPHLYAVWRGGHPVCGRLFEQWHGRGAGDALSTLSAARPPAPGGPSRARAPPSPPGGHLMARLWPHRETAPALAAVLRRLAPAVRDEDGALVAGPPRGTVGRHHVTVAHDDWCGIVQQWRCHCHPDVRLK